MDQPDEKEQDLELEPIGETSFELSHAELQNYTSRQTC